MEKCESDGNVFTTYPAKLKCVICGQKWTQGKQAPVCTGKVAKIVIPKTKCYIGLRDADDGFVEIKMLARKLNKLIDKLETK